MSRDFQFRSNTELEWREWADPINSCGTVSFLTGRLPILSLHQTRRFSVKFPTLALDNGNNCFPCDPIWIGIIWSALLLLIPYINDFFFLWKIKKNKDMIWKANVRTKVKVFHWICLPGKLTRIIWSKEIIQRHA